MPRRPRRTFNLPPRRRRHAAARAWTARLLAALLACAGGVAAWSAPAWAGVGLAITPEFPATVRAGATGVPASLSIGNLAFGGEGDNSAALQDVTLVPSCGIPPAAPPDVNCSGGEDTSLRLAPTAAGNPTGACGGRTFAVTEIDPVSGRYRFVPDQPVVLGPRGSATDTCLVDFTFDVARVPARDGFPDQPGVQTTQVAYATATFSPSALTGSGTGTDVTTVAKPAPSLDTQATPTASVGQPMADLATLAGGVDPTGSITFTLFGPGDETCTTAPVFSSTVPVAGAGSYTSEAFTPAAPGTYRWVASYSGDERNDAVTAPCGPPEEMTEVGQATPGLDVRVPPSTPVGRPVTGRATLTGGAGPSGAITFNVFAPDDTACEGSPVFTSSAGVTGEGRYTSGGFSAPEPGTYRWVVVYEGDPNNAAGTTPCGEAVTEVRLVAAGAPESPQPAPATTQPAPATPRPAPASPTGQATQGSGTGDLPDTGPSRLGWEAVLGGSFVALGGALLVRARRPRRSTQDPERPGPA